MSQSIIKAKARGDGGKRLDVFILLIMIMKSILYYSNTFVLSNIMTKNCTNEKVSQIHQFVWATPATYGGDYVKLAGDNYFLLE